MERCCISHKADAYVEHLNDDTFKNLNQIKGFKNAYASKKNVKEGGEFVVLTIWESMDAVKGFAGDDPELKRIAELSTKVGRATRGYPDIRRGSSIRGAIDFSKILKLVDSMSLETVTEIAIMTLATKIELEDGVERSIEEIITEVVEKVMSGEEVDFL